MTPTRSAIALAFIGVTMVTVLWLSSPDLSSIRWMQQETPVAVSVKVPAENTTDIESSETIRPVEQTWPTDVEHGNESAWLAGEILQGEPFPDESNIFFMETSCWDIDKPLPPVPQNESGLLLSGRAACAIESAATLNPNRTVYILHTCPVNMTVLLSSAESPQTIALRLPNVRLWLKPVVDLFDGSPLDAWSRTGQLERSRFPRTHTSDVLRFLLLSSYGGLYLDTDVVLQRPMAPLHNFASAESDVVVASAVLGVGLDAVGRLLAGYLIEEITERFRGDIWGFNGPWAVTRALTRLCNTTEVQKMTEDQCGGFMVLPQDEFFAIPWEKWNLLFDEMFADSVMHQLANSHGVHFWNNLSHDRRVLLDSQQPYAQVARQHCPRVVAAVGRYL